MARRCFDAVGALAEVFPTRVFPQAFGLPAGGDRQLLAYGSMVFKGHGPRNRLFEASMVDSEAVVAWITEQCSRRSLRPGSIGARVYEAVDQGEITETEAGMLVRSFLSAGVAIPAGAKVLVLFAGANRHPERWDRPDDLVVGRRTAGHLGYGTGIHNCVGQVVARMEGTALIRALAERVESWHLEGPPVARLNNTLRGLDHLPVRVEPA